MFENVLQVYSRAIEKSKKSVKCKKNVWIRSSVNLYQQSHKPVNTKATYVSIFLATHLGLTV